jgi:hypothetical protein
MNLQDNTVVGDEVWPDAAVSFVSHSNSVVVISTLKQIYVSGIRKPTTFARS